jgi:hypothetical protein
MSCSFGNNQPRRWARIGAPRYVALALAAVFKDIPPWTPPLFYSWSHKEQAGRSPEFVRHAVADALPDIIAGRLAVVFCGINPGMTAAAVGHHFAGRGNRFWRVIHLAGFTPEEILPENDRTILRHRCGLTATWLLMLLI